MMMRVAGAVVIAAFLLVAPTGALKPARGQHPVRGVCAIPARRPAGRDRELVERQRAHPHGHVGHRALLIRRRAGREDLRVSVQHRRYLQLSLHDSSEHGRGDRRAAGDPRAPAHGAGRGRRAGRLHRPHRRPGAAGQHPDEQGRDHLHHGRQCDTRPRRDLAGDTRGHRDGRLPGGSRCRCEPDPEATWLESATSGSMQREAASASPSRRAPRTPGSWWKSTSARALGSRSPLLSSTTSPRRTSASAGPREYASSSSTRTGSGPRSRRVP